MNWTIEKTTSNERVAISNALYGVFADLERAETLLHTVCEDCFGERVQKALAPSEASWARDMIYIVKDILGDAILAYYLTVADTESVRAKNYIKAADRVKTAVSCEQAHDSFFEKERHIPTERNHAICEVWKKIMDMDDETAIEALKALTTARTAESRTNLERTGAVPAYSCRDSRKEATT